MKTGKQKEREMSLRASSIHPTVVEILARRCKTTFGLAIHIPFEHSIDEVLSGVPVGTPVALVQSVYNLIKAPLQRSVLSSLCLLSTYT